MRLIRFRLRFLLQELDLPQGETLLGRSTSCHLTFEDPLVSRQHARIRVDGERATVEDLSSRNGLLLNGRPIKGMAQLEDGDRLRIGVQELLISKIHKVDRTRADSKTRITGFLCHCAACGVPYPTDLVECPSCGSVERADEDTLSDAKSDRSWSLELLVEVIKKAASLGRWDDVDRILMRARANVERHVAGGHPVELRLIDDIAEAACSLSLISSDAQWARWVLSVYESVAAVPPTLALDQMARLPALHRAALLEPANRLLARMQNRPGSDAERMDELARAIGPASNIAPGAE
ncbi:MAG: FHA domain-containing protein [Polyangiaceae bacterium]|nr:FHA domain-containing protein [Polyangiaceae bacterium]